MIAEWSESAVRHLQAIHDYIASDSEQYALRMVDRLTRTSVGIAALPEAGHIVPEYDSPSVREVIHSPYRII
ncbi:MAG TPA: type II toxin-antitoxin system RelE/ParE family toxin [Planctomycetaceae bacterium]|nr:type II toxin-antitoxin system RelE/ParE family toxin [Planctomycetaceae bacterium]